MWSALATALAEHGVPAPAALDHRADYATVWREPGLVLSQTCGYPYATALRGADPVGGDAGLSGDAAATARVTARCWSCARAIRAQALADLRGRRVAFNATDSQSGYNALRAAVAPLASDGRFFAGTVVTGSHGASADAVAAGEADLCAIDCVTWAMLGRYEAARVAGLRVIGQTASVPGLPLITGMAGSLGAVREAVTGVMIDPDLAAVREALLIEGIEIVADLDYDAILAMERQAAALGYPALA